MRCHFLWDTCFYYATEFNPLNPEYFGKSYRNALILHHLGIVVHRMFSIIQISSFFSFVGLQT